jgi:hypothetical protein
MKSVHNFKVEEITNGFILETNGEKFFCVDKIGILVRIGDMLCIEQRIEVKDSRTDEVHVC